MAEGTPAAHEQICLSCWLTALGIDREVGGAIIGAAFRAGQLDGLTRLSIPLADAQQFVGPVVVIGHEVAGYIIERTQRLLAVPVSPEVAQAMRNGR